MVEIPELQEHESEPWHALPVSDGLAALASNVQGLSDGEARSRLSRYGANRLEEIPGVSSWRLAIAEFTSPLILILIGAAGVLFAISAVEPTSDHVVDAILILAIVLANGILGFVQNYRAESGIASLKRLASPQAAVMRDGRQLSGDASMLVPGDIALIEEGDRIPADGRVIEAYALQVDESALTGESLPRNKSTEELPTDTQLADRESMVYSGTSALRGRGRFLVTATGMATEMGQIARAVQTEESPPGRFQRDIAALGARITTAIAVVIALTAVVQLTIGDLGVLETFLTSVALAVAAIPEGLPVVLTLALAFGTRRMVERNALVRSLPIVEVLGSADVICADKTGTITEGRMALRTIVAAGDGHEVSSPGGGVDSMAPVVERALIAAGVCNNAVPVGNGIGADGRPRFSGDPTEVALLDGVVDSGVVVDGWEREDEFPFSSERKMMSVVARLGDQRRLFVKGAPEVVVALCDRDWSADNDARLTEIERKQLLARADDLAGDGLRVLALAERRVSSRGVADEEGLEFLGFAGLSDPPRPEVRDSMRAAASAGIRTVMITGDNSRTAIAVGHEVGFSGECLSGRDLDQLDDEGLRQAVRNTNIFARCEPDHKLRILRALRADDRVVVMTGDGVNDAPALYGADVGIAMGVRGTDVARDASNVVLLDDNYATIVAAVAEGRRVFANIRKFLSYLLIGNFAEVAVVLIASVFGYLPVTAVQLLWINLVTDGGPAIALGVDPPAPGTMSRPPDRRGIVTRPGLVFIGAIGAVMTVAVLAVFAVGLERDLETARSMAFTAFVIYEYAKIGVIKYSEGSSLFANRWLNISVTISLALQLMLLYTPAGAPFDVVALDAWAWSVLAISLLGAVSVALAITKPLSSRLTST